MSQLIMMRHGQSLWNLEDLFTGWVDVPLSPLGITEALAAGEKINEYSFDYVYTSTLVRAQQTALLALSKNSHSKIPQMISLKNQEGSIPTQYADWNQIKSAQAQKNILPVIRAWQLNERYYGDLQGMNKKETAEKYGKDQVHIWRRSFDVAPPNGESLKDTAERAIPFFKAEIEPLLKNEKNIFIAAHGNSLRAIIMYLENLSPQEITQRELATGKPISYLFNSGAYTPQNI